MSQDEQKNRPKEQKGNPTEVRTTAEPNVGTATAGEAPREVVSPGESHPLERELEEGYALRDPSEDPKWSVLFFKGWLYFMAVSLAFVGYLLIASFLTP